MPLEFKCRMNKSAKYSYINEQQQSKSNFEIQTKQNLVLASIAVCRNKFITLLFRCLLLCALTSAQHSVVKRRESWESKRQLGDVYSSSNALHRIVCLCSSVCLCVCVCVTSQHSWLGLELNQLACVMSSVLERESTQCAQCDLLSTHRCRLARALCTWALAQLTHNTQPMYFAILYRRHAQCSCSLQTRAPYTHTGTGQRSKAI